jgi:hypothetical protein
VVRVALDLGVEEADGGGLTAQERIGVVEVLPRSGDGPLSVVVKLAVLVARDDVPRLERLDVVDRVTPRTEGSGDCALGQVHVDAVVDHVARDDEIEIRDVKDGRVIAVVWPTSTIARSWPSSIQRSSGTVTAVTEVSAMPSYTLSHSNGRAERLACICAIVPALATTRAPNRSASSAARTSGRRARG